MERKGRRSGLGFDALTLMRTRMPVRLAVDCELAEAQILTP